ncbi:hypothetical protein JZ751_025705 [Albula glossodonta]|uniref:Uncharacterized protein n=1 Tax=Albula glossodonta TaxID=121402 RepID=A0A8T2NHP5_9TELE|nr:hypothetical protein JZ751_025705 [Albula glossodonta]
MAEPHKEAILEKPVPYTLPVAADRAHGLTLVFVARRGFQATWNRVDALVFPQYEREQWAWGALMPSYGVAQCFIRTPRWRLHPESDHSVEVGGKAMRGSQSSQRLVM